MNNLFGRRICINVTYSANRLASRLRNEDTISFDKDDDDTLDFVTAAANLRAAAYNILGKSRWEVKGSSSHIMSPARLTLYRRNGW